MKKLKSLIILSFVLFFSISCTKTEVVAEDPAVVFTNMTASKTELFIDDVVTITVEGSGFTDANLTTSNSKIKITKLASTVFEISSKEALTAIIYAELKNKSKSQVKSTTINFSEHGVKNFNTVEGIKVNTDKTDKVLKLLGEPDFKSESTDGTFEFWRYTSKGFDFAIKKSSKNVESATLLSSNTIITIDNVNIRYTNYPYEIGNGWKINDSNTTMDLIVNKFGIPTRKTNSVGTLFLYEYLSIKSLFYFNSASLDDFDKKVITRFVVY